MTAGIIPGRELAKALGLMEAGLHKLGRRQRLPFSVSAAYGMFVHRLDVPAWREAAHLERENGALKARHLFENA
jgi:hypothetical protein